MSKRKTLLCFIDFIICFVCFAFMAILGKFSIFSSVVIPEEMTFPSLGISFLISVALIFGFRIVFGVYKTIWRYAGVGTYLKIVLSDFVSGIFVVSMGMIFGRFYTGFGVSLSFAVQCCLLTLCSRFIYQFWYARFSAAGDSSGDSRHDHRIDIAIVGAGNIGASLAQELLRNPKAHYRPVCFVDSDPEKAGQTLNGLPVLYTENRLEEHISALKIQEIVIALPELNGEKKAELYETYKAMGCKVKLYDFPLSETGIREDKLSLREICIEDLLFRDNINIANTLSESYYKDKTVLVTGGGGSIGSELCRQIAKLSPKKLVIFDIYENNAYDTEQELRNCYGDSLSLQVYIGSVRDAARLNDVFAEVKPDIVLHAAAHKHVPLMEASPAEAVKNNIFGTYNTVCAAERHGVSKFVLISSDKAVNPTNVMGATKRFCEMIVRSRSGTVTHFAAVRFGNVLGSNGSVIPLFKKQIEKGGPVTITDKRIIRYFMTIPEAAELVLEAGAMAHHGELYVLEMGKPVKIWDLAVNMIKLAGLEVGRDIEIKEIGLRPGEKLYEELLVKSEHITKTDNSLIFIEKDTPLHKDDVEMLLNKLRGAVELGNEAVVRTLKEAIPTFVSPEEVNRNAESTIREELDVAL